MSPALSGALAHGTLAPTLAVLFAAALAALVFGRAAAARRSARLLGASAPRDPRRRDWLLVGALAAAALALLGPRFGERTVRVPASGVDVVILLDVSTSMLARDVPPSRLERARALAREVLTRLGPGDRAALAAFAGEGVLLTPLTPDHAALAELAPALDDSLLSETGSRISAGVRAAARAYRADSSRPRVLLLLSDGEEPDPSESALTAVTAAGLRVVAVVFGTEAGAPVVLHGTPLRDWRGETVVSRSDPARLAELVEPSDGALLRGDRFGGVDPDAVVSAVRRDAARAQDGTVERRVARSATPALAGLAFALALAATAPERRRGRGAAALAPVGASARRARAAVALLALTLVGAGAPRDDAALEGAVRRHPESGTALVRLGLSRASAGELEEAERAFFAAAARAHERDTAALAWYDLGVAALERGDLERARDAFFDALALAPDDREARFNLEWVLRALAARAAQEARRQPLPAPGSGEDRKPADGGEGGEEGEPEPGPDGESREPAPREPRVAPEGSGGTPVQLSPDAAAQWLAAVEDDPGAALRAVGAPKRRGGAARVRGPRW
ncbi:MAG TPA: VWA domain-containing protein [Myxococcota bacterium]|jgi:Ca-activated chloride channel family protein|nr:VWA domain-containing protein [Myxococcota bacterium]